MTTIDVNRSPERMREIADASYAVRSGRAQIRSALRAGQMPLADLLADPPACIHDMTVLDVLCMLRTKYSKGAWKRDLGAAMIRDRINLLVPVDKASERTLTWAVQHGQRWAQRGRSRS